MTTTSKRKKARVRDPFIKEVAEICQCSMRTVQRAVNREKGYNEDVLSAYNKLVGAFQMGKKMVAQSIAKQQ